jgi:calcineurin-like phosphoesterase family protein
MNTSHIHKLGMMNGHKIVVLGNHDSRRVPVIKKFAQRIEGVATKKIGETRTVMTHIPVHPDELIRWEVNIHGHLHDKAIMYSEGLGTYEDARYINVSLERWEFFPASRTEITRLMQLRGYA